MFSQLTVFYYFVSIRNNEAIQCALEYGQRVLIEIAIGRLGDSGDLKPNKDE